MDYDRQLEELLARIINIAESRKQPFRPVTVLIDGPSGAGKTWSAATLAGKTGWRVVHLDEFYPGWHGLERGSEIVHEQVLRETNPGYWRWDWEVDAQGEWASLDARDDLIVEGVGAVTEANVQAAAERGTVITVGIYGPREARRARAIERDPNYAEWFETWEAQESHYFEALATPPELVWEWTEGAWTERTE